MVVNVEFCLCTVHAETMGYNFNCNFISNQLGYKKDFGNTNLKEDGLFIISSIFSALYK